MVLCYFTCSHTTENRVTSLLRTQSPQINCSTRHSDNYSITIIYQHLWDWLYTTHFESSSSSSLGVASFSNLFFQLAASFLAVMSCFWTALLLSCSSSRLSWSWAMSACNCLRRDCASTFAWGGKGREGREGKGGNKGGREGRGEREERVREGGGRKEGGREREVC